METKLRPCPFCANTNVAIEAEMHGNHKEYWVICRNCGALGPADLGWSGAEEAWNMRRPTVKLLEACKAGLKFIATFSSFMGKESVTEKKMKAAIRAEEGEGAA